MTRFADQLFDDLMHEYGPEMARVAMPAAPRRRVGTRTVLLTAGAGCLAVAAVVGSLVATGGGAPAYAVTRNSDGAVTLSVYDQSGISGANQELVKLGDGRVVTVPVRVGCESITSLPKASFAAEKPGQSSGIVRPRDGVTVGTGKSGKGEVLIATPDIPAGDVFVVAIRTTAQGTTIATTQLIKAPAPSCVSVNG
jgi:hypothetical protein